MIQNHSLTVTIAAFYQLAQVLMDSNNLSARIIDTYSSLDANNIDQIGNIYAEQIVFKDPAHCITGLPDLKTYFSTLYRNVHSCEFEFEEMLAKDDTIMTTWVMQLRHPKLRGGELLQIPGCTQMKTQGEKIIFHRDYFDLGSMLYEHIPVLGWVVTRVKEKLGG